MIKKYFLSLTGKRTLKIFHLIFAALAFGGLLTVLVLLLLKKMIVPADSSFYTDLMINKIFEYCVNYPFYLLITTSLLFGLFTEWGFLKHYWIIVKWIILILLLLVTIFLALPSINGMVSLSDSGFNMTRGKTEYDRLTQTGIISISADLLLLAGIMVVSVFRPWEETKWKLQPNRKAVVIIILISAVIFGAMTIWTGYLQDRVRKMQIENTDLKGLKDGKYPGNADIGGYRYRVEVVIRKGRIAEITAVDNRKSKYAGYAEGVFRKIIRDQNANTDAVTGATTTSKALMKAVANALRK
jgi:uncharacterized protein with FMN-binding domain